MPTGSCSVALAFRAAAWAPQDSVSQQAARQGRRRDWSCRADYESGSVSVGSCRGHGLVRDGSSGTLGKAGEGGSGHQDQPPDPEGGGDQGEGAAAVGGLESDAGWCSRRDEQWLRADTGGRSRVRCGA